MKDRNNSISSGQLLAESEENKRAAWKSSDRAESPINAGFRAPAGEKIFLPTISQRSEVFIEFVTVAKAAELEGESCRVVTNRCSNRQHKKHYRGAEKVRVNGVDVWRIPVNSLSSSATAKYRKQQKAARLAELEQQTGVKDLSVPTPTVHEPEYALQWERFERKPGGVKEAAQKALDALLAYWELVDSGVSKESAKKAVEASHGAARATLHRSISKTKGHPRRHWLPLLCPQWHGGRERAPYTPEAQAYILALKIRSPHTNLRTIIREAKKEGANKGWLIPSEDTVAKRLKEEAAWLTGGMKALERSFPTVERDYLTMAVHQCWESDGRRADVFCVWPDGQVARPFVIAWREVRTRKVLSLRICFNPDAEAVMASFGAALAHARTIPELVKIDNGREYANKAFTGAQKTRYRFKPKVDEAIGILTSMGIVAKWAKPGQGRDKPIESWWNVIAENCDKSPAFAGAYCGNNPASKPEDFDKKKAVPVEAYAAKLIETVNKFHNRPHRGHGMSGRTPLQVEAELASTWVPKPPNESELRRCKMGVRSLKLDKKEATFKFAIDGYLPRRYWHEALADLPLSMRDRHFNVHYEWDNPDAPVAVYSGDTFICDAAPIDRIPFIEGGEKVHAHMEAKGQYIKQRKNAINAAKELVNVAMPVYRHASAAIPLSQPQFEAALVPPRSMPEPEQPASTIQPLPGKPGEFIDVETGEVLLGQAAKLERNRQQQANERQEGAESDEELEELARKQWEKNVPAYFR